MTSTLSQRTGGKRFRTGWVLGMAGVALAAAIVQPSPARITPAVAEPATTGGPATFRRLNEEQLRRSINDIFGADIKVPGRFDPPLRAEGLMAIGDGRVGVSSSGIEQYELRAREISAQVLAADRRKTSVPCAPQSAKTFDRDCATAFLTKYGRLLYRRPMSERETASALALASAATTSSGDFYKGLEIGLARLLSSPNFIFRLDQSQPDPQNPGVRRLDDYSLATRISFLLWDAPPDSQLLDAAASGALRSEAGLGKEVDRLIASPRFELGVRAFFSDMFAYEQFDGLSKDQAIYPKFTSQLAKDAREQTLRTIVDLLVTNKGDYRDLFTTRKTFLNRNLGSLYQVPLENGGTDGWVPHDFGPNDPRAGILTLAAFLMLDPTHEGRSSPTIRGKSVRELFLCQTIPLPPANVNFSIVQNDHDQVHKTARERLAIHRENPVCSACHAITDPIGLAAENYDASGAFRTHENGALIDVSGTLDGKPYNGLIELQKILQVSPDVPQCVAQRAYEYGVGRQLTESENNWLQYAGQSFASGRYAFPGLMRLVATSKAFQAVSADGKLASK